MQCPRIKSQSTADSQKQVPILHLIFFNNPLLYWDVRHSTEEKICQYFRFIATLNWPAGLLPVQDGLPALAGFTHRDFSLFTTVCAPAGACEHTHKYNDLLNTHTSLILSSTHSVTQPNPTQPARSVHIQLSIR